MRIFRHIVHHAYIEIYHTIYENPNKTQKGKLMLRLLHNGRRQRKPENYNPRKREYYNIAQKMCILK